MVGNRKTTLVFEFKVGETPVELPGFVVSFIDTKEDSVDLFIEEHYRIENWAKAQYRRWSDYHLISETDGEFCATGSNGRCLYAYLPDYDDTDTGCEHIHNVFSQAAFDGCKIDRKK